MSGYKKIIPSKLLNTLDSLNLPDGVTKEGCVIASHLILNQFNRTSKIEDNKVEVSQKLFKLALDNSYTKVIDFLKKNDLIIVDDNYNSGLVGKNGNNFERVQNFIKCKGYCINPDQFDIFVGSMVEFEIENKTLNNRTKKAIDKSIEMKKRFSFKPSTQCVKNIHNMQFDYPSAIDWLRHIYNNQIPYKGKVLTPGSMSQLEHMLRMINLGNGEPMKYRYIKRNDINGRIDSDITNLSGNFRRFIKGDDLYQLDIKSSQPTLMILLFNYITNPLKYPELKEYLIKILTNNININTKDKKQNRVDMKKKERAIQYLNEIEGVKLPSEDELKRYIKIINDGQFYEYFQDVMKDKYGKVYDRDQMKVECFTMFFIDWKHQIFNAIFPSISKFIMDIVFIFKGKNHDKNLFPIMMQVMESFIWMENILPKLDSLSIQYYSIHDSVIVPNADKDKTEEIIRSVYNQYHIDVCIDIESNNIIKEYKEMKKKNKKIGIEI